MSQQSRTTVKTYFETGDTPTQEQFATLIDSAAWYDEVPSGPQKKHPFRLFAHAGFTPSTGSTDQILVNWTIPANTITSTGDGFRFAVLLRFNTLTGLPKLKTTFADSYKEIEFDDGMLNVNVVFDLLYRGDGMVQGTITQIFNGSGTIQEIWEPDTYDPQGSMPLRFALSTAGYGEVDFFNATLDIIPKN